MKTIVSAAMVAAMLTFPAFAAETPKTGVEAPIVGAPDVVPKVDTPEVAAPDATVPNDATAKDVTPKDVTPLAETPAVEPMAEQPAVETAKVPATDAATDGKVVYLQSQDANQVLASGIIGASVVNGGNETVGNVNDIVFDKDGKVIGVVIGVGGFLGLGEQDVAVAFDHSLIATDANGTRIIKLNVTKETLKDAKKYVKLVDKAS